MTTVYTHGVVGLGLARLFARGPMPWAYWGLAAVLPVVPDLDAFSTVAYGTSASGHRGFTHSLLFAAVVGAAVAGATCRYFRMSWWRLAGLFFIIIASHGLLDALTRGGADIPFFWPLPGRWGNWGPMPASHIGFELPNPFTQRAMRSEMFWVWLPLGVLVGAVTVLRWLIDRGKNTSGERGLSS
jgi:inner membrane protein